MYSYQLWIALAADRRIGVVKSVDGGRSTLHKLDFLGVTPARALMVAARHAEVFREQVSLRGLLPNPRGIWPWSPVAFLRVCSV